MSASIPDVLKTLCVTVRIHWPPQQPVVAALIIRGPVQPARQPREYDVLDHCLQPLAAMPVRPECLSRQAFMVLWA